MSRTQKRSSVRCMYLWCKARCCSGRSSSSSQATGRGAWPPCGCPRTSTRCRAPGWRGPEPEWSRSGRAGSGSDGTCAPAWPRGEAGGGRVGAGGGSAGGVKGEGRREDAKSDSRVTDGAERHGQMLWLGRRGGEGGWGDFKSWRIAKFKTGSEEKMWCNSGDGRMRKH